MNGIPVTVEITVNDVLMFSGLLEAGDREDLKNFSEKLLKSTKETSDKLQNEILVVNGANPYCMENKI